MTDYCTVAYKKIFPFIQSARLKEIYKEHIIDNNWNVITKVRKLQKEENLNTFDTYLSFTLLGRSASLKCKYKSSLDAFEEASKYFDLSKPQNDAEKLADAFYQHSFAISLGYMGKTDDRRYNTFLKNAEESYKKSNGSQDLMDLLFQKLDVGFYERVRGPQYFIRELNKLAKDKKNALLIKNEQLRIGIYFYKAYLQSNDTKYLKKSIKSFTVAMEKSSVHNYQNFWARCGLVVVSTLLKKEIPSGILDPKPSDWQQKSKPFPEILFLISRALRITGENQAAFKLCKKAEGKIKTLLQEFPDDASYQKHILGKYGILIEEWIIAVEQSDSLSINEKFRYMIHANEILQNRVMAEARMMYSLTDKNQNNVTDMIKLLGKKTPGSGLAYFTFVLRDEEGEKISFFLTKPRLNGKKITCKKIMESQISDLRTHLINKLHLRMRSTKAEQEKLLDDLGDIYLNNNAISFGKDVFVVPNDLLLQVPFHMLRKNGEYLYDKTNMHYWPSLKIASTEYKKRKPKINTIAVFYNSAEKMSVKEAKIIKSIMKTKETALIPDPSPEEFRGYSNDADHIHIVTHFDGTNVKFSGRQYSVNDITNYLSVKRKSIILHICSGGGIRDSSDYPINHDSISHLLTSNGAKSVIGYIWDLPQQTSIAFSEAFYKSSNRGESARSGFKEGLQALKRKIPSDYGGYMVWGRR